MTTSQLVVLPECESLCIYFVHFLSLFWPEGKARSSQGQSRSCKSYREHPKTQFRELEYSLLLCLHENLNGKC